jgi:hypothetical protein
MHPLWAGVLNADHARRQNPVPQPPPPGVPGACGEGGCDDEQQDGAGSSRTTVGV